MIFIQESIEILYLRALQFDENVFVDSEIDNL